MASPVTCGVNLGIQLFDPVKEEQGGCTLIELEDLLNWYRHCPPVALISQDILCLEFYCPGSLLIPAVRGCCLST